jgi:transposase
MWVYCSGTDSPSDNATQTIVLYDYHASRAGSCAVNYLQGFKADGYQAMSR